MLSQPWLKRWFAINTRGGDTGANPGGPAQHRKVEAIPQGVEGFGSHGYIQPDDVTAFRAAAQAARARGAPRAVPRAAHQPARLLLVNFGRGTGASRDALWRRFCGSDNSGSGGGGSGGGPLPFVTCLGRDAAGFDTRTTAGRRAFLAFAAAHPFWLSPPGNGPDCYRTYEALYLGSAPVVLDTALGQGLVQGAPIVRVRTWGQLTEARLLRELRAPHTAHGELEANDARAAPTELHEQLRMGYWRQRFLCAAGACGGDGAPDAGNFSCWKR